MNLNDFIMTNEVSIRLGFFFGVFAVMAAWEVLAPKRALTVSKAIRWANNLGLVFFNSFILRLLFPAAVGMAAFTTRISITMSPPVPVSTPLKLSCPC